MDVKLTHTEEDALVFATIKIDNNPTGVIGALNKAGYTIKNNPTRSDLGSVLKSIYNSNKTKWVNILQNVPYLPSANNYTTSPQFQLSLIKLVSDVNKNIVKNS